MSEYLRKILGAGKTPLTKSKPIAALTADAGPDIPGGDGANEGFWRSQLRDPKTQQFIEMGGGIICSVTLPDGTVAKGTGFFKGNSSPGIAIIEFKGSEGVPDGQYNVPHENILGQADAIIPAKDLARAIDKADGVIDDPKNKKTRVRKMSMEGEEALSKIKGDAALVAKEQGRFPIARGPEDIKAAAKKQYEGVFAALQKEHPDLVKDFKSFDAFWDHAEKNIAIDTSQRWADSVDEIPELTKATNRIYAREVLGLDPDGLITFYRNSINHHDNPDKAAAGYISLDQRMAWNYNSDKEQSGYDGRYAVKAAPDEVLGLLGYSKIADEYGVVVGPDVTSQPNRYERVGDLAWTPLNPLMDPKKTQMGTTGDSWFRHFRPASSFDFPVMDSKPFEDGEGWPDFYKQFNLQKGDIPNKYDELHGEGAFDQDFPESKGVPNYANFVKYAFTEKDGKYAFDPIYLSSGEFSASNATSMEPDKGDKLDLGLKFLSTIQELSGKAFMVHRSHDKNDERLKDAQIETPKAEEPKGSDFSAIGYSKEESLKDFLDPANGVVVAPGSMVKNKEGKSVVADDAFFMAGNFPYYKTPEQTLLNYGEIVLPDAGKEPEEAIKLRYDWIEKNKDKFLQTNNYKFKELARKKAAELGYNDEQAEVYAAAMQNSLFSYLYSKASILAHDLLDYTYKNYPEQYKDSEAYKKLEKISEFESKLAEYTDKVAKANVAVAVEGMDLISVLNDGRIKNQFETMKSRGAYDPENRIKNELIVSGTPIDTPAQKRSIFGYLFTSDQASTRSEDSRSDGNILHLGNRYTDSYGKFKVVLKPSIKERTTFTVGDSLERGSQNSQILSQNLDRQAMKEAGLVTGADIALNQTPATLLGTYLEAQIHGGISLSDIERIVYTGDESDETLQLVKTKIKDLGLSISVEGLKSDQGAKDFTGFKKVSGPLGSNEGGLYEDPSDGTKYYVKVQNKERGENEALGSALYEEAGLDALKVNHGILDGKPATYTEWREDLRPIRTYLSEIRPDDPVMDGYAVDAWLANWDVVGTAYDNLSFKTGGEPVRLDAGGSLLYRARGERKGSAFGEEVGELETFKDDSNTTGQLYGKMSPEAEKKSVERLAKITPERIDALVDEYISDPNDNKELKEKLKSRREFILKKYETETPTNDNKPIEPGYENWFDKLADIEKKAKKLTDEEGIENSYFYEVIKAAGFDKKPELVSEESLSTSKSPKLYRGVTSPKQIEDLKNSDKLFMGKGDFGNGLYFSTNQNAATIWAKKGATKDTGNADASEKEIKERMATAVLADDAKILSFSDGMKILSWAIDQRKLFTEKYREKYPKGSEGSVDIVGKFFEDMDFPSLMVMSGYDAFEFEDGDLGGSTVIVLNRGKLKVATPQEDQFAEKKPETKVKKLGNEPNVKASDEKIDMLISKISRLKIEDVEKLKDAIKNGTLTNELADELSAKAPGSLDIVNDPVMLKAMLKRHVGDSVSPDEMQDLIDGKRTKDNYGFYHASNRELKVGDIIRPTESFDASARHGGLSFDIKKEMSPEEWEKKRAFALLDGGQKVKGLSFYISRAAEISGEPDGMGYFYRVKPVGTLSAFPSLEPEWNTDGGWEIVNVVGKASIHDGMVDSRIHFDEDTDTMWHDEPEEYNSPDYGKRETDDIIDTSSGDMPVLSQIIKTEKTNEVGKGTVTLATEFEYVGHRNWDSSYLDDDEIEAITEYRAGGYAQINELLRTARLKDSEVPEEKVQKWIDTLDSAIDTWGSPMRGSVRNVVYRGQVLSGGSAPEVGEADMAKIISNLSPGMILEDRGFLSASTSPTIAYKEFGPGLYERGAVKGDTAFWAINVPDDVNALFSPNDIGIAAEKELIFHRNSKLAIKGIRKITGEDGHSRYFIEADMLAPESELIPKTREESSESSPELAETLAEIAKNREEPESTEPPKSAENGPSIWGRIKLRAIKDRFKYIADDPEFSDLLKQYSGSDEDIDKLNEILTEKGFDKKTREVPEDYPDISGVPDLPTPNRSKEEKDAIEAYQQWGYFDLKTHMETPYGHPGKSQEERDRLDKVVENLDKLTSTEPIPEGTTMYRGVDLSSDPEWYKYFSELEAGDSLLMPTRFSSATLDPIIADEYSVPLSRTKIDPENMKSVVIKITAGEGATGAAFENDKTVFSREKEVLLPLTANIEVTKIEKDSDGVIRVEGVYSKTPKVEKQIEEGGGFTLTPDPEDVVPETPEPEKPEEPEKEEPVAPTVDTFTEDEGKSLEYYSRGASETSFIINEFLRNNKVFDPKAYLGVDDDQDPDVIKNEKELNYIVDNVENAIYKYGRIESPTTLYRGIEEYEDGLLENLSVGDTISEPGFSSTSVKESVAKGFTDRDGFRTSAIFKINAPENSYGLRLGEDLYEKYPYFGTSNAMQGSEVLLPSNTKFKITSIKKEPMLSSETGKETGKYLYSIEVDLIPQEPKIVETKKPKSNKPKVEEKAGSTKYKTPLSRILEEQDEDPNQDILVYAKVPEDTKEGSIPPGTLVTTDESIAEVFYGSGKVIKFSIPAKHLLADKKNFDDDPVMSYNPPTSEPEKPEEPKVEENPYLAKSRGPIRN
jgi:hypothetical protein